MYIHCCVTLTTVPSRTLSASQTEPLSPLLTLYPLAARNQVTLMCFCSVPHV